MGRGVASNPPPLYVRGLISFINLFCHKLLNYLLIGFLHVNLKMCMYCVCTVVLCVIQGFQFIALINL